MKRQKRLTKKERKQQQGPVGRAAPRPAAKAGHHGHHDHIHCIACGKHLEVDWFGEPDGADFIRCEHGSNFPHCVACFDKAKALVEEHDRNDEPVNSAAAWH